MHAIKAIDKKRKGDTTLDSDVSRLETELVDHGVSIGTAEAVSA
jgi:hypothetical protein